MSNNMAGSWQHPDIGIYYYRKGIPAPLQVAVARVLAQDEGRSTNDLHPKFGIKRSIGIAKLTEAKMVRA